MENNVLGKNLRQLRIENGLTSRNLAKTMNLAESTLSLYESGKRSPSYDILLQFSQFFEVSIDELLSNNINNDNQRLGASAIEIAIRRNSLTTKVNELTSDQIDLVIELIKNLKA